MDSFHFGMAVVVLMILLMRKFLGIVGAGGTTRVADFSLSPAMLLPVTFASVRPSGICTVISVFEVVPAGTPLM